MESMEDTIKKQEESFASLTELDVRGSIALSVFSKNFFPMFVEYFGGTLEPNLNYWFTETGTNGYQPVDVYDGEEVVFVVPPIFESKSNHAKERNALGPAEHMALVQMKDNALPGSGTNHANEVFKKIGETELPDESQIKEFYQLWTKIFNYYGYESSKSSPETTVEQSEHLTEDDIDGYEDL